MPRLPPSIPSIFFHTTLLIMMDPDEVTSLAYLEASKMLTPFPTLYGLSQFLYPCFTSRTQLMFRGISLLPRCSNFAPLSLCSWNRRTSTLGAMDLRNLFCLRVLMGSLRPLRLCARGDFPINSSQHLVLRLLGIILSDWFREA